MRRLFAISFSIVLLFSTAALGVPAAIGVPAATGVTASMNDCGFCGGHSVDGAPATFRYLSEMADTHSYGVIYEKMLVSADGQSGVLQEDELSLHRLNTLLDSLRANAIRYRDISPDYDASIYISGNVDVLSRGCLNDFIPILNRIDDGVDNYYAEFIGGLTFTNPNIYNHSLYSISSNKKRFIEEHIETIVAPCIQLNVYSQYFLGQVYSPLAYKSGRYYIYSLDSSWVDKGNIYYRISFAPRINNYKFVEGYLVASGSNFSIREISVKGKVEFINYSGNVQMGEEGTESEFLPRKILLGTDIKFLGTRLSGEYTSMIRYNKINPRHIPDEEPDRKTKVRRQGDPFVEQGGLIKGHRARQTQYDLSLQYSTRVDTLSAVAARIVDYRDSIHTEGDDFIGKIDTLPRMVAVVKNPSGIEKMGRFMIRDYSLDLKDLGQLHIAPLVSPLLFDYSTSRGVSYNQKVRLSRITTTDKLYTLEPRVGYNFKYKEFYWGVNGEVNYAPRRMGRVFLDMGNGNKFAARSGIAVDTSGGKKNEFRALHARVGHKIEVANGFTISTNIALHRYSQIEKHSNFYSTFVPELELQYTPKQYYYMNGERKVYLYSPCPTFTLNFAHSFKGVMGSTTRFNKVEFDMQQKLRVGPMHSLHYRVGFGLFYDYSDLYFAEFNNLKRNNLPEGWDDDIGGTFHLLSTVKYNEIDKYLRANIKYDAPLILVPSLFRKVKYITKERLYCNMLLVDTMDPYIEMGYGIGTNIFNVGLFWGGEITKWDMVGVKFTFEVQ
ncbi:MAG: hypothetical protein E7122_06015 [Bacteroidales bacterium]|nr:hypothetical protein [Bacteroidales bacterium]